MAQQQQQQKEHSMSYWEEGDSGIVDSSDLEVHEEYEEEEEEEEVYENQNDDNDSEQKEGTSQIDMVSTPSKNDKRFHHPVTSLKVEDVFSRSPTRRIVRWTVSRFPSYLVMIATALFGMLIYYISEVNHDKKYVYATGSFAYFFTDLAGDMFLGLVVVPRMPKELWQAIHSGDEEDNDGEEEMDPQVRRRLRFFSYSVFLLTMLLAYLIGLFTTDENNSWAINMWHPFVFVFSGIAGKIFLYLLMLPSFPEHLQDSLRSLNS